MLNYEYVSTNTVMEKISDTAYRYKTQIYNTIEVFAGSFSNSPIIVCKLI